MTTERQQNRHPRQPSHTPPIRDGRNPARNRATPAPTTRPPAARRATGSYAPMPGRTTRRKPPSPPTISSAPVTSPPHRSVQVSANRLPSPRPRSRRATGHRSPRALELAVPDRDECLARRDRAAIAPSAAGGALPRHAARRLGCSDVRPRRSLRAPRGIGARASDGDPAAPRPAARGRGPCTNPRAASMFRESGSVRLISPVGSSGGTQGGNLRPCRRPSLRTPVA